MSDDRREYTDYISKVVNNLKNKNYDDSTIEEVIKRVDHMYNDIDYHFPRKGWKYLIKHFTPEVIRGENVIFECFGEFSYMCVYNKDTNKYTVTFTFLNSKDIFDPDYKKYLVYNYFKEKYTYKDIDASTYKNAVVIAYNRNVNDFPKMYRYKLCLELGSGIIKTKVITNPDGIATPDNCFKTPYASYKRIREQMMTNYELQDKDIRFYIHNHFGILVIRKNDSYTVSFSFINPVDRYHLNQLKNVGDIKHIARYWLIHNLLSKTYTYEIKDAPNSMYAAVMAYNNNRFDFPSYYHDNKLDVFITVKK